jgi:predicted acylesterase/phospholipase RssA
MTARPKTALVLSAGGVFGAYQAGVWKALREEFEPDLIVGSSIGAINGYLIASDCAAHELEDLWLHAADLMKVRPKVPRHWSQGVLDGAVLRGRLLDLCGKYRPRIPFGVVATDMRTLRPRCFTGCEVGCDHLLASCAVLGAFDMQTVEGRRYTDGGLLGALPWWSAVELGATRIVAVNVLPKMPLPIRAVVNGFRKVSRFHAEENGAVEVLRIEPARPLGKGWELLRYRQQRVREWLELGYTDGLRFKHSIAECFERE